MTIKYKELKVTAWNPKGKSFHKIKIPHYEKNQTVSSSYIKSVLKGKGLKGMTKLKYSPSNLGEAAGKISKPVTYTRSSTSGSYGDEMSMPRPSKYDANHNRLLTRASILRKGGMKALAKYDADTKKSLNEISFTDEDNLKKIRLKQAIRSKMQNAHKFWQEYEKKTNIKEAKLSAPINKNNNESPFKGGDTKEKSTPYKNPHSKAKQLAREAMRKKMKKKLAESKESLDEAKKYSPAELAKMSKRERGLLKMKAKEEVKKRQSRKTAAKIDSPAPVAKAKKKEELTHTSRLDWFNSQPTMQKWLRANVHPADRERVMNDIWDAPAGKAHGVFDDYEAGKKQYRKMPKATL